jgi:Domain of unknown function (DUF4386)
MASVARLDTQAVQRKPEDRFTPSRQWSTLYRVAAIAALSVVALIPLQAVVFFAWPPPSTVLGYFDVFQSNALLGLLDLDLLLVVDELLMIPVLLGLYVALKQTDESVMLLAIAIGLVGVVLFLVAREATISMLWLSNQYAGANSEPERAALVAAGQTLLTTYNGTAFSVGYFLTGLATLLMSCIMLRGAVFGRTAGVAGVLAGATALVPASFGTLGLVLAFVSLLPLMVWLFSIGRRFLTLAGDGARASE